MLVPVPFPKFPGVRWEGLRSRKVKTEIPKKWAKFGPLTSSLSPWALLGDSLTAHEPMRLWCINPASICYTFIVPLEWWDRGVKEVEDEAPTLWNPKMESTIPKQVPFHSESKGKWIWNIQSTCIMRGNRNTLLGGTEQSLKVVIKGKSIIFLETNSKLKKNINIPR